MGATRRHQLGTPFWYPWRLSPTSQPHGSASSLAVFMLLHYFMACPCLHAPGTRPQWLVVDFAGQVRDHEQRVVDAEIANQAVHDCQHGISIIREEVRLSIA